MEALLALAVLLLGKEEMAVLAMGMVVKELVAMMQIIKTQQTMELTEQVIFSITMV